ncbi:MAG: tail fiber domain-containing protein [Bacteroidota bacterium]
MKTFTYTFIFILSLLQLQAQVSIKPDSSSFESKVTINNTLEVNGLTYPEADGNQGQVLATDGAGNLIWTSASGQDYSSAYQFVCNAPQTYFMTINNNNDVEQRNCGTLYDSGGANGGYGSNEQDDFQIIFPEDALQVKILLNNLDLEAADTLWIQGVAYHNNSPTTDTLIFSGIGFVEIVFASNGTNNGIVYDGFEISWEYLEYISGTSVGDEILGFFFDVENQAVGGGVDQNNAWSMAGERAVLFGYGSSASDYGSAIGYFAKAKHESSIAIGRESLADTSLTIAIGDEAQAKGVQSIALGNNTQVLNKRSIGLGIDNYIEAEEGVAIGIANDVRGEDNNALGRQNNVTGERSTVLGRNNNASGNDNFVLGYSNATSGDDNFVLGYSNSTFGDRTTLLGYDNRANGDQSSTLGIGLDTDVYRMTAVGSYNTSSSGNSNSWFFADPLFVVGNGTSNTARSNALTILKSGKVGIGNDNPTEALVVNGDVQIGSTEKLSDEGARILSVNSNFVPATNGNLDLGSSSRRWDDVYATNGTINTSDRRSKSNIKNLKYGLEEIMQLQAVRYRWKGDKSGEEKLGLIAQDLLKVLPEVVKTHEWVASSEAEDAPLKKVEMERLGVYYSDIIPVLISAMQEQQDLIAEKEAAIQDLEENVQSLEERLAKLEALILSETTGHLIESALEQGEMLAQNHPNPFQDYTTISYNLPANVKTAQLQIMDAQGHLTSSIPLQQLGVGQVAINTTNLSSGVYYYRLLVDGQVMESKKMNLVR